jgi:hypothetical protein
VSWLAVCVLAQPARAEGEAVRVPVLLELFTSEGCSSCPPADAALDEMARTQPVAGAEVVPLELHVDYWNRLGWTDPFSASEYSQRQESYGSDVYTPQMIVDGTRAFVGSAQSAREEVARAARESKSSLALEARVDKALHAVVRLGHLADDLPAAHVWIAVTEDGLSTDVPTGENAGRTLRHAAVVRALRDVGPASSGSLHADIALQSGWKRDRLRAVAWIQEVASHRVRGVATAQAK